MDADAIVIGAGLAGLTATAELARSGRRVLLLDQEPESKLGGGMHGYRSLEGSFLGGCLFSGRQAGRAVAREAGALRAPGPAGSVKASAGILRNPRWRAEEAPGRPRRAGSRPASRPGPGTGRSAYPR